MWKHVYFEFGKGGLQAAEVMLYTVDRVNEEGIMPRGVKLGAHILDDCDKDTYGLQQAVDFIKGKRHKSPLAICFSIHCIWLKKLKKTILISKKVKSFDILTGLNVELCLIRKLHHLHNYMRNDNLSILKASWMSFQWKIAA